MMHGAPPLSAASGFGESQQHDAAETASGDQNLPAVPAHQTKPKQEPGTRHQVP
jgi:hypothetical protein